MATGTTAAAAGAQRWSVQLNAEGECSAQANTKRLDTAGHPFRLDRLPAKRSPFTKGTPAEWAGASSGCTAWCVPPNAYGADYEASPVRADRQDLR